MGQLTFGGNGLIMKTFDLKKRFQYYSAIGLNTIEILCSMIRVTRKSFSVITNRYP